MLHSNCGKLALVGLVACLAAPAFAQGSGSKATGADIFKTRCAMCHGADGKANTPAGQALQAEPLKDPRVVNASDDELAAIVKKGKNKMPAFGDKLTDDQINAVIAYIRTLPD